MTDDDASFLRRKRAQIRLGDELTRRGDESGIGLRQLALHAIRHDPRARRAVMAEQIELGEVDLGDPVG